MHTNKLELVKFKGSLSWWAGSHREKTDDALRLTYAPVFHTPLPLRAPPLS